MATIEWGVWAMFGVVCALFAAGAALAFYVSAVRARQAAEADFGFTAIKHIRQRVEAAVGQFRKDAAKCTRQRDLLDVYTPEYFNTLHMAGWNELNRILDSLEKADRALDDLIDAEDLAGAECLVNLLTGNLSEVDVPRTCRRFPDFIHLQDWKNRATEIVIQLAQSLQKAAIDTKEIGIDRSHDRKRKPTLMALDEIREMMSE